MGKGSTPMRQKKAEGSPNTPAREHSDIKKSNERLMARDPDDDGSPVKRCAIEDKECGGTLETNKEHQYPREKITASRDGTSVESTAGKTCTSALWRRRSLEKLSRFRYSEREGDGADCSLETTMANEENQALVQGRAADSSSEDGRKEDTRSCVTAGGKSTALPDENASKSNEDVTTPSRNVGVSDSSKLKDKNASGGAQNEKRKKKAIEGDLRESGDEDKPDELCISVKDSREADQPVEILDTRSSPQRAKIDVGSDGRNVSLTSVTYEDGDEDDIFDDIKTPEKSERQSDAHRCPTPPKPNPAGECQDHSTSLRSVSGDKTASVASAEIKETWRRRTTAKLSKFRYCVDDNEEQDPAHNCVSDVRSGGHRPRPAETVNVASQPHPQMKPDRASQSVVVKHDEDANRLDLQKASEETEKESCSTKADLTRPSPSSAGREKLLKTLEQFKATPSPKRRRF